MKIRTIVLGDTTQIIADPRTLLHKPGLWFLMLRTRHRIFGFLKLAFGQKRKKD